MYYKNFTQFSSVHIEKNCDNVYDIFSSREVPEMALS